MQMWFDLSEVDIDIFRYVVIQIAFGLQNLPPLLSWGKKDAITYYMDCCLANSVQNNSDLGQGPSYPNST